MSLSLYSLVDPIDSIDSGDPINSSDSIDTSDSIDSDVSIDRVAHGCLGKHKKFGNIVSLVCYSFYAEFFFCIVLIGSYDFFSLTANSFTFKFLLYCLIIWF